MISKWRNFHVFLGRTTQSIDRPSYTLNSAAKNSKFPRRCPEVWVDLRSNEPCRAPPPGSARHMEMPHAGWNLCDSNHLTVGSVRLYDQWMVDEATGNAYQSEFSHVLITRMIPWSSGWQVGHIIYPFTFPKQCVMNRWAKVKQNR